MNFILRLLSKKGVMEGQIIGYIRVSTLEQNADRQLEGIQVQKKFIEKASARTAIRPELQKLLMYAREGDTIYVHSIDRMARNLLDLRKIVDDLLARKVKIKFIKENLFFTGEDSPISMLLLNIMGAFAEFERALIRERQLEGIRIAREKGKYAGRKPSLTPENIIKVQEMLKLGLSITKISEKFMVSRHTIYKYLREQRLKKVSQVKSLDILK